MTKAPSIALVAGLVAGACPSCGSPPRETLPPAGIEDALPPERALQTRLVEATGGRHQRRVPGREQVVPVHVRRNPGQHLPYQVPDERHVRSYDVLAAPLADGWFTGHQGSPQVPAGLGKPGTEEKDARR